MKQLRRLTDVMLQKETRTIESNGATVVSYSNIDSYKVINQQITDQVFVSIYGANVSQMRRISSPHFQLEKYLSAKVHGDTDNISRYFILIGDKRFKITAVYDNWVDIEFLENDRPIISA